MVGRGLTVKSWLAWLVLALSVLSGTARAECDELSGLAARASTLSASTKLAVPDALAWLTEVTRAVGRCPDAAAVRRFNERSEVQGLHKAVYEFRKPPPPSPTANSGSSTTPVLPGKWLPVSKAPLRVEGESTDRLGLARAAAQTLVKISLAICGDLRACEPKLKQQAINGIRAYVKLVADPKASDADVQGLAEALAAQDNPFNSVPQVALDGVLEKVKALESELFAPGDPRSDGFPPDLRALLVQPPTPARTNAILRMMLDLERDQRPGASAAARSDALSAFVSGADALRVLEKRIASNAVRRITLKLAALPEEHGACRLRSAVDATVVNFLTEDRVIDPGILKRDVDSDASALDEAMDLGLSFELKRSCEGDNDCLVATFQIKRGGKGTAHTAIGRGRSLAFEGCPSEGSIRGLLARVLGDVVLAESAADIVSTDTVEAQEVIRAIPQIHAAVPVASRDQDLVLVDPNVVPGLGAAIREAFRHAGYRKLRGELREGIIRLGWQSAGDKSLRVQLRERSKLLWELNIGTNQLQLAEVKRQIANRIVLGVIQHYETGENRLACQARFTSRFHSLVLSGLHQLGDCRSDNDWAGVLVAGIDGGLILTAAALGYWSSLERSAYSRDLDEDHLQRSRGLFIGASAALGGVLATRLVTVVVNF